MSENPTRKAYLTADSLYYICPPCQRATPFGPLPQYLLDNGHVAVAGRLQQFLVLAHGHSFYELHYFVTQHCTKHRRTHSRSTFIDRRRPCCILTPRCCALKNYLKPVLVCTKQLIECASLCELCLGYVLIVILIICSVDNYYSSY